MTRPSSLVDSHVRAIIAREAISAVPLNGMPVRLCTLAGVSLPRISNASNLFLGTLVSGAAYGTPDTGTALLDLPCTPRVLKLPKVVGKRQST